MSTPPFRVDHVGSWLRPDNLNAATKAVAEDPSSESAQKAAADALHAAIASIVEAQQKRRIRPITSGEYDRELFLSDSLFNKDNGFENRTLTLQYFLPDFPSNRFLTEKLGLSRRDINIATRKITHQHSAYLKSWLALREHLSKEKWGEAKLTILTPTWQHMMIYDNTSFDKGVYSNDDEYFDDLVKIYRKEIMTLYDAGLRFIQFDDPHLTFFCDEDFIQACNEEGVDLDARLDKYIQVYNKILNDLPGDLSMGVHLCRGNVTGGIHLSSGGYDKIAEKIFATLNFKTFYLEFDTDRSGTFEPLKFLPEDKVVVLGLVTTKFAELEDLATLKKRVYEAAEVIAKGQGRTVGDAIRDNIAISPQCGFASAALGGGVGMTEEIQWKKMEVLQTLAKDIWG